MRRGTSQGQAKHIPMLTERERQICARCFRTRYEHEKGLIPDHPFEEVQFKKGPNHAM